MDANFEKKYDKETLVRQLNEGFTHLSDKERLVLTLYYFEELTEEEISYVLELSFFDVDMLLTQAKTIMRTYTNIFDELDKSGSDVTKQFT